MTIQCRCDFNYGYPFIMTIQCRCDFNYEHIISVNCSSFAHTKA